MVNPDEIQGFVLPSDYKYVVASLLPIAFLLFGQTLVVGRYRKKAGIEYPQLYADKAEVQASRDAYLFNCAQRAHQNTLEVLPSILIIVLVSGITFPKTSAAASLLFLASRVVYTRGYVSGDHRKRISILYHLNTLSVLGLLLVNTYIAVTRWVIPEPSLPHIPIGF